ncbi:hypothetical protein ABI_20670 [Asticcacaulis biprosthecium C19]|uniref:Pentapeptide repeat-containing protein n=1 Tax=Asticcacaulis biprosthecium C19 TaxID=715226 RepID=F4QM53_9CAUL|nr:hypothetical protein ABI_20670 [Asticcacaulis biprosthecium C19]
MIAIGTVDFSHCKFKSQLIVKNSLFFSDFICFGDSANEQLLSGNQTIQIEKDQNGHLYTGVIRESDSQQIEDFQTINQFNCAGSIYYENFDISNRNFKSKAVFDYATFYGVANFHGSTLHDGTTFYNTDFRKAIRRNIFSNNSKVNFWKIGRDIFNRIAHTTSDPKLSINYQGINALPAKLKSHLRLLKIRKLKYIKISSKQEYDDMSAASHRLVDAILSFTLYKKFIGLKRFMKSSYFSKLESCFRKLKKEMGDNERLNSKHMFYVLEVMSRRRRPDAPPFDRLVAVIYGILSGYGEKILTPLVITFILLPVTFSTIYWAIFETRFSLSESMLSYDNLKFLTESYKSNFTTYANIAFGKIYPAGIFDTSADFEKSLKLDVKSVRYFFFKCLGTMESIIGIGTTFLAGIALKRKFNLGS